MKKIYLLAMAFIVTGTFIACQQEKIISSHDNTEVTFSSNIVKTTPTTKVVGSTWEENDIIGVYMLEEGLNVVVAGVGNIPYDTPIGGETGSFTASDQVIYFPDNGDKVRFMAYYPYRETITSYIYPVNVSDQRVQKNIDLLYSINETPLDKTTPDKKVPLVFDHQLTKIIVHVKAGEGLDNVDLAKIKIYFTGLNTTADFTLMDGTLSNPGGIANITPVSINPKATYAASFEAIVLPAEEVTGAQILFDLDNGDTEQEIESDLFSWHFTQKLLKGTKYTYNAIINRSGIVIETSINDWISKEEENIEAE